MIVFHTQLLALPPHFLTQLWDWQSSRREGQATRSLITLSRVKIIVITINDDDNNVREKDINRGNNRTLAKWAKDSNLSS